MVGKSRLMEYNWLKEHLFKRSTLKRKFHSSQEEAHFYQIPFHQKKLFLFIFAKKSLGYFFSTPKLLLRSREIQVELKFGSSVRCYNKLIYHYIFDSVISSHYLHTDVWLDYYWSKITLFSFLSLSLTLSLFKTWWPLYSRQIHLRSFEIKMDLEYPFALNEVGFKRNSRWKELSDSI